MASSQISLSASSSTTLIIPTKYYGRNEIIAANTPVHKQTIESIRTLTDDINKSILCKNSNSGHKEQWADLNKYLEQLASEFMNEAYVIEKFRFEAINEVIIPYINEMKSPRVTLDKSRFEQIKVKPDLLQT